RRAFSVTLTQATRLAIRRATPERRLVKNRSSGRSSWECGASTPTGSGPRSLAAAVDDCTGPPSVEDGSVSNAEGPATAGRGPGSGSRARIRSALVLPAVLTGSGIAQTACLRIAHAFGERRLGYHR